MAQLQHFDSAWASDFSPNCPYLFPMSYKTQKCRASIYSISISFVISAKSFLSLEHFLVSDGRARNYTLCGSLSPYSTLQCSYLTRLVVPLQHNQHLFNLFGLVNQLSYKIIGFLAQVSKGV